jgi:hypothetical protein
MESQSTQPTLKVCPRCATATRTEAETCPSCGRRYRRRYWIGALGVVVVALAFAGGLAGRELLNGGDSGGDSITNGQGNSVATDSSREQLDQRLDHAEPSSTEHVSKGGTCVTYPSKETPSQSWVFCFRNDQLYAKYQVGSS